ncbi:MAG: type II toxin-antitoxin system PemK/MazF family toxin [Bryobacteraceae bacterium]
MKRGELYLVRKPGSHDSRKEDPRKQRVFVVASRQALIDSRHSSVVCAPVYSQHDGLSTQVAVGTDEGLKKDSSIHCDDLMSLPKSALTHYLGTLAPEALRHFDEALTIALALELDHS